MHSTVRMRADHSTTIYHGRRIGASERGYSSRASFSFAAGDRRTNMKKTFNLPDFEFTVRGHARLVITEKRRRAVLLTSISAQPWIKLLTANSKTTMPEEVAFQLTSNPQLIQRIVTIFACALVPSKRRPGFDAVPMPLIDAMPDQLLHAAGMALPMMFVAICNYLGLPHADLNQEIEKYTGTLRRALKDNLGVPAPGHPEETKREFLARMKQTIVRIERPEGGSPKQKEIASELGWSDSYLRARLRKHGIKSHNQLLNELRISTKRMRSIKSRS
jgi:AraC-like DNA-binding protein